MGKVAVSIIADMVFLFQMTIAGLLIVEYIVLKRRENNEL